MTRSPVETKAWKVLGEHAAEALDIRTLLATENGRAERLRLTAAGGTVFDLTRNLASLRTIDLLLDLAREQDVAGDFRRMMAGEKMNATEDRAARHTDLRRPDAPPEVMDTLARMQALAAKIRADKTITDVIHIGIGGSVMGTRLACDALRYDADGPRIHFVASFDADELDPLLATIRPQNTLVLAVSKTFTTQETLHNLHIVRAWLQKADAVSGRIIAITANAPAAREMGIADDHILPHWDWVGGRYSVWSAVGFALALACGFDVFRRFLDGAHAADRHVAETPLESNIPVLMALLQLWYRNFKGAGAYAVLPYIQRLSLLPAYLQQLEMESNGKRVDRNGQPCACLTAPVVFGAVGTNSQHTFMQMIHQGIDLIPCDFVGIDDAANPGGALLFRHMQAQIRALTEGGGDKPHAMTPGNRPATAIILPALDAFALGQLMAMEEHKTAALGFLWNINSFDQFGVELGKRLAKEPLAR